MVATTPYRRDIDGLRGLSILLVLGFHAFPSWVKAGFVGVDVFFVISGYLIGQIILAQVAAGSFTYADFYCRRVLRIFPSLLVAIACVLVIGWLQLFPLAFKEVGKHVVASAGFFINHLLWLETGYFDAAAESKPLLHLWSLAIEEQFYLALPLLLILVKRRGNGAWLPWLIATLMLASLAMSLYDFHTDPRSSYYRSTARFWELMAGVFLAAHLSKGGAGKAAFANIKSGLGTALLAATVILVNRESGFPGWWALLPVAGTCLLVWAGEGAFVNRHILSNRFLVGFGLISYPLYLFHWVTLFLLRDNLASSSLSVREGKVLALFVAVAASWLVFRFIETPVRKMRSGRMALGLAGAMAVAAFGGAAVYANDGFPQRFSGNPLMTATNQRNLTWFEPDESCIDLLGLREEKKRGNAIFCSVSHPEAITVAVVGDSTANALFPGLAEEVGTHGQGVINVGGGNCPAILGLQGTQALNRDCDSIARKLDAYFLEHTEIRLVVLSVTAWGLGGLQVDGLASTAGKAERDLALAARIVAGLKRWQAPGRNVVFIIDTPNLGFESVECLRKRDRCVIAAGDLPFQDIQRNVRDALRTAGSALSGCEFRVLPVLATDRGAMSLLDASDNLLFRDTHHLSYSGSALVARQLLDSPCVLVKQSL